MTSNPEMTAEQRKCEEDVGHDFRWYAPEWDTGFTGYGECKLCGRGVPYEDQGTDLDDNYM